MFLYTESGQDRSKACSYILKVVRTGVKRVLIY